MTKNGKPRRGKPGGKPGPRLVHQEHGGALWIGGHPDPTPGTGRPPSAIRAAMREALEARVGIACSIADDPAATPADRIRALDLLGRYGLGTAHELSGPDQGPLEIHRQQVAQAAREFEEKIKRLAAKRAVYADHLGAPT